MVKSKNTQEELNKKPKTLKMIKPIPSYCIEVATVTRIQHKMIHAPKGTLLDEILLACGISVTRRYPGGKHLQC